MKILVLSESFIIRDSLNHLLNETLNTNDIITSSNANHLSNEDLLEVDLSFIDINKNNINIVERLSKIRNKFENLKIGSIPCGAIHCSIGAAYYPDHGMNFDELYHYADEALYEAKRQGRNTYVIYHQEKENLNH